MPNSQELFVEVIVDQALDFPLDYSLPYQWNQILIGTRVLVPIKKKHVKGTVINIKSTSSFPDAKPVTDILFSESLLSEDLLALAHWMSRYYIAPLYKTLKVMLPPTYIEKKASSKTQKFVKSLVSQNELREICILIRNKSPRQAKVLDQILQSFKGLFLSELMEKATVSKDVIETLCKKKILHMQEIPYDIAPSFPIDFFPTYPKTLNLQQQKALDTILQTLETFTPHLLFGITGSGKTEVYLQAMQCVLKKDKSVVFLVPEIALTTQIIEKIKARFGEASMAILHHRLSKKQRFEAWHRIQKKQAQIIIGARSAIFSPSPNIGLIIVDEEHEASYKQMEEAPKYHARDLAIMRAKFACCPVILGSATPCMESFSNAVQGKYQLHTLSARVSTADLPKVTIVDMQKEFTKAKGFVLFSDVLLDGIKQRMSQGEQTILFLNRRGYHTCALCQNCSYVLKCSHCDLSLTYHLGGNILACHLCDFRQPPPQECPSCHNEGPLKYCGVGTELVQKSLHAFFPEIRSLRLDADTTRHFGSHEKIFREFRGGKADVLIGTQMIAKGLHLPSVTLVGVIGTDASLNIPDFRSCERVFQLLTQVAGRSGRGILKGEVVIQTQLPNHPTIVLAGKQDYVKFYEEEIQERKLFSFPPFTHCIKFGFADKEAKRCEKCALAFRHILIKHLPQETEIHPVIPCGYAKIKNLYRFQFFIKTKNIMRTVSHLEKMRKNYDFGKTRLSIDVDPQSTYF